MVSTRGGSVTTGDASTEGTARNATQAATSTTNPVGDQDGPATANRRQLQSDLLAAEEYLQQLTALKEARAKAQAIEDELAAQRPRVPSSNRDRPGSSSSNSSLTTDHLPTFRVDYDFRKRDEWIQDHEQAFEAAPRRFRKEYKKV